ncbi:unnamed protein product [Boreogadus saida]
MEPVLELDPGPPEEPEDTSLDRRRTRKGRSGLQLYACATLTIALLCLLQATLNVSLRLHSATSWTKGREHLIDSLDDLTRLGWLYFDQSLYFISTTKKNWEASRDFCLNRGADLLVINSKEEQEFVRRFRHDSWIGLSDRNTEGTWKWVDGTNLTSTVWLPGEPNDYGTEDCALAQEGGWNDDTCAKLFSWICEKKVVVLDHLDAELKKHGDQLMPSAGSGAPGTGAPAG